jgi:hypothetical protein
MDPLEIALVVLVSVWTLVSLVLGFLAVMLLNKIKAGLDKVDELLRTTTQVAEDVRAPVHAVAESVREVFGTGEPRSRRLGPDDPLPAV